VSVATAPFYTKQTPLLPAGDLRRWAYKNKEQCNKQANRQCKIKRVIKSIAVKPKYAFVI